MEVKRLAGNVFIAIISSFIAIWIYSTFFVPRSNSIVYQGIPSKLTSNTILNVPVTDFTVASEQTIHAVVHVKTRMGGGQSAGSNPFFDFFFGQPYQGGGEQSMPATGVGSGVIITQDGYIVTNNHVIEGAGYIEIALNDKRTYSAVLIGTDPSTDLALLKIDEQNLPIIPYGNSDELKVGEWVLAVGNPFNLTSTVTAGIVSAKGRNINILQSNFAIESFIQTDAAVNPGNSGGALVNQNGELVGINTAIASLTGSFSGYSFAIPVNIVKKIVEDLIEFGSVQRALLGVSIRDMDAELVREKGLKVIEGVYVAGIMQGGAADDAGIKENDIILKIGNHTVNKVSELQEQVNKYRPGDNIKVTLKRNDKEVELKVVLKNKNGNTAIITSGVLQSLGASFEELTPEEKLKFDIKKGLRVEKIFAGKMQAAGIKEGFIITSVNGSAVESYAHFLQLLESLKGGVIIEGRYPEGQTAYYAFGLE